MFQAEEATNNDSPDRTVWRAGQGLVMKTILAMMMKMGMVVMMMKMVVMMMKMGMVMMMKIGMVMMMKIGKMMMMKMIIGMTTLMTIFVRRMTVTIFTAHFEIVFEYFIVHFKVATC